jgi:enoyl-CoA hydratase/carnithine racemase
MKNVQGHGSGLFKDAYRLRYLHSVLRRIASLSIPVIAAVEGPAIGVGWSLALTCDFIVAGSASQFIAPFGSRSLVPDGAIAFHLVRGAGRLRATEILVGGRPLKADEALKYDLVSEVVDSGAALGRAVEIAEAFAARSRDTTTLTLRALRRAEDVGYRAYLDAEYELASLNLHNPSVATSRLSFKAEKKEQGEQ